MPVRIRLAANGAARNSRTVKSITLFRSALLDGVDEQIDVVIEEREVVANLLDPADRWRQHEHLCAGLTADRIRRLRIEVGLDQHELDVLAPHLADQIERVLR